VANRVRLSPEMFTLEEKKPFSSAEEIKQGNYAGKKADR
jgi:hypothetical protein